MVSMRPFDQTHVEVNWDDLPAEVYLHVLDTFAAEGEDLCYSARVAFDAQRMAELGRIAHTMRGASANVGALFLSERAAALEAAAAAGTLLPVSRFLIDVEAAWEEVRKAIQARQASRNGA